MEIYGNNHSVFALYYQLVFVTKNRSKIFNEDITKYAIDKFNEISKNYLIELYDFSYEKDHVHIKFKAHPKSEISKFINAYKSATSRLIKKEFEYVNDILKDGGLWERTYFLITEGVPSKDMINHYIKTKIKCDIIDHDCQCHGCEK
ncbi:IS200/IS605 family transposase [Streptobacillus moniliformis]|uniref:Transposase IS200-family protein n=1 Tax=Streptobacillus moniliformis (strain ATCC 14647 / DSM 12112 / NCTC 10651 / 9901) TaxID=519441 RepID=D1AWM8_STRM9|nr:IS200/IS605 family transposase [Streptobacillus moniliformis]ACZ00704.1 transposase IS200-family protein [Streptobacillus moniliformis DSM 12112]AVL42897.1 IS200/IS605 family transposase [Streptobacillus moniliformis]QXW65463.1 IS200/IS605 family transposase [Streptobacillus moniliformis]SQA14168.1 Transposase and inactivated derivatives [Streptobacillus moniliformis]